MDGATHDQTTPGSDRNVYCFVLYRSKPFSVKFHPHEVVDVYDLKGLIQSERGKVGGVLHGVEAADLELWQLKEPELVNPDNTFADRIRARGDHATFSKRLDSANLLEHLFSEGLSTQHVHILVEVPTSKLQLTRGVKRGSGALEDEPTRRYQRLCSFYKLFWGATSSGHFITHEFQIPDEWTFDLIKMSKREVITLPPGVFFPHDLISDKILVTDIYKTFWDLIRADDDVWRKEQRGPHHATVIKGQPGIGKTFFLTYVLIRRLQDKLPTVYCGDPDEIVFFDQNGVRVEHELKEITELVSDSAPWCGLVNLGDKLLCPPRAFHPTKRMDGRVVLATSPNPEHLRSFSHENTANEYCMPTWSWEDLYCGKLVSSKGAIRSFSPALTSDLSRMYHDYAGVPRVCYASRNSAMQKLRHIIDEPMRLKPVLIGAMGGSMPFSNHASHKVVRIEPKPETGYTETYTEFLSNHVAELTMKAMENWRHADAVDMFDKFLGTAAARGFAGKMFEQLVHRKFRDGYEFTPQGMTHPTHGQPPLFKMKICTTDVFTQLNVRAYIGSRDVGAEHYYRYYIPQTKTKESLDAVLFTQFFTVLFQITVSPTHPINLQGIVDILREIPANAKKDVRIVFVVPDSDPSVQNYRRQTIRTRPTGYDADEKDMVERFPQYVYYINVN